MITVIKAPPAPKPRHYEKHGLLRECEKALLNLKPGQALRVDTAAESRAMLNAARFNNMKLTTRKTDGIGYIVWKLD